MSRFCTTSFAVAYLLCAAAGASDLFQSRQQRDSFLQALAGQHDRYDPAEQMLRRPFSSPGYHTTLKAGYVHPTRESLAYAVALLDSGEPNLCTRAQQILRKVILLQDRNPASRTFGIWPWFLEEPLDRMSPPDWNWADFCGTQLLQVARDHIHRLPDDLQQQLRCSITLAAQSVKRRNVGPDYTNIAVMGTYVTLAAGELFNDANLFEYGKARLRTFHDHTIRTGSFTEYNSPTYTVVAIGELSRMIHHIKDPDCLKLLHQLDRLAWLHLARHFHPPTRQWAGPHSRCYSTLLDEATLAFIQRATDNRVGFMPPAEALKSLDAHRLAVRCPEDLCHYFTELSEPRLEIETFVKAEPPKQNIIGTTYLHPLFTLGSVNIADLWNQRRPLIAYCNTDKGVVAIRLRCLHDDYDYASASIFAVQGRSDVLGAVVFATDRGDTHISLDRIKDGTITAKDLRVRLQLEGAVGDLQLPQSFEPNKPATITIGRVACTFNVPHAVFDDYPVQLQVNSVDNRPYFDVVLYAGPERRINFNEVQSAVVIFTLSLSDSAQPTALLAARLSGQNGQLAIVNSKLSLTVPLKPMTTIAQRDLASGRSSP